MLFVLLGVGGLPDVLHLLGNIAEAGPELLGARLGGLRHSVFGIHCLGLVCACVRRSGANGE
jgi:hypothetical protein